MPHMDPRDGRDDRDYRTVEGAMSTAPAWLKAAAYIGVPAVLSLYLVWVQTQDITPAIKVNTAAVFENKVAIAALETAVNKHIAESSRVDIEVMYILRSICINAANTKEERDRCLGYQQR